MRHGVVNRTLQPACLQRYSAYVRVQYTAFIRDRSPVPVMGSVWCDGTLGTGDRRLRRPHSECRVRLWLVPALPRSLFPPTKAVGGLMTTAPTTTG